MNVHSLKKRSTVVEAHWVRTIVIEELGPRPDIQTVGDYRNSAATKARKQKQPINRLNTNSGVSHGSAVAL